MGVFSFLSDSRTARTAHVDASHAVRSTPYVPDVPGANTPSRIRYFTGLMGSTGLDGGTTDMATTADSYFVLADTTNTFDIYITYLQLGIADASASHDKWGNISALSTGCTLQVTEAGQTTTLWSAVKTFGQVLAQSGLFNFHTGGSAASAFQLSDWTTGSPGQDLQACVIPFALFMPAQPLPGLRLGRGTKDQIEFVVADNLSGVDEQFIRVYGYKHFDAVE